MHDQDSLKAQCLQDAMDYTVQGPQGLTDDQAHTLAHFLRHLPDTYAGIVARVGPGFMPVAVPRAVLKDPRSPWNDPGIRRYTLERLWRLTGNGRWTLDTRNLGRLFETRPKLQGRLAELRAVLGGLGGFCPFAPEAAELYPSTLWLYLWRIVNEPGGCYAVHLLNGSEYLFKIEQLSNKRQETGIKQQETGIKEKAWDETQAHMCSFQSARFNPRHRAKVAKGNRSTTAHGGAMSNQSPNTHNPRRSYEH